MTEHAITVPVQLPPQKFMVVLHDSSAPKEFDVSLPRKDFVIILK